MPADPIAALLACFVTAAGLVVVELLEKGKT